MFGFNIQHADLGHVMYVASRSSHILDRILLNPLSLWTMTKMASETHERGYKYSEDRPRVDINSQPGAASSYQELCATFLDTTSAHGLPRLRTDFGIVRKVLWAIVFVGFTGACSYQSYILVERFLEYDVNVAIEIFNK